MKIIISIISTIAVIFTSTVWANCPYFTRPEVESCDGVTRTNYYSNGTEICYQGYVYQCRLSSWTKRMACSEYPKYGLENAEKFERSENECQRKFNDSGLDDLLKQASDPLNDPDIKLSLDQDNPELRRQRDMRQKDIQLIKRRWQQQAQELDRREQTSRRQQEHVQARPNQEQSEWSKAGTALGGALLREAANMVVDELVEDSSYSSINTGSIPKNNDLYEGLTEREKICSRNPSTCVYWDNGQEEKRMRELNRLLYQ